MAHLPQSVAGETLTGLEILGRGKVRDTYVLSPEFLLPVTSNRASIFDFVLPFEVALKGEVLNAINIFNATKVFGNFCPQDIEAFGIGIDNYLPAELQGNPEYQKKATVVRRLNPWNREAIVRNYLLGSSVAPYNENQTVSGHRLPDGLKEGDELPYPIFTPSTKAEVGHDEHVSFLDVEKEVGNAAPERLVLQLMAIARRYYQHKLGLDIADTKFELAYDGQWYLIDERITPDSSRIWDLKESIAARKKGKLPPSRDKQYLRDWGKTMGLDNKNLDPDDPKVLDMVAALETPHEVVAMTTKIYRYLAWRVLGEKLENFQRTFMGIDTKPAPVNIQVILGSRSDLPQAKEGLKRLNRSFLVGEAQVNIISCHRNPDELSNFTASDKMKNTDVIVAGAGLAAALPGMTKAFLKMNGNAHIPVIGVGFEGSTNDADNAAILSIEQLPGKPVEMDDEHAYFGQDGFEDAVCAAINDEFLPNIPGDKEAEFNIEF